MHLDYDCNDLPKPTHNGLFQNGCAGAVYSDGRPSKSYCLNEGTSKHRFGWYEACCDWKEEKCVPNETGDNLQLLVN